MASVQTPKATLQAPPSKAQGREPVPALLAAGTAGAQVLLPHIPGKAQATVRRGQAARSREVAGPALRGCESRGKMGG